MIHWANDGSEDEEISINNIDDYEVGNSSSDEDPFNTDSDHETSTTESGTSTIDKGDNETSEREDIDIIDLCSGSDDDCTMNRSVMPEDCHNFRNIHYDAIVFRITRT